MGLDMYLYADEYISDTLWQTAGKDENGNYPRNPTYDAIIEAMNIQHINKGMFGTGISVKVPMGYWRKANAIHGYFVREMADGRDECQPIYVHREALENLKSLCEQVLADNSLAEALLPPEEGFFFGSYEIDEYYLQDLQQTIEIINLCLESPYQDFEYHASW